MTENAATPPIDTPSEPLFVRPREGRMLGGVCAGIAQRWHFDVTLVRVLAAVLALASGVGVAAYLAAWLLTPSTDAPAPLQPGSPLAVRSRRLASRLPRAVLVVLAALLLIGIAHATWGGFWVGAPLAPLLILLAIAALIGTRRGRWALLGLVVLCAVALGSLAAFGSHVGTRTYTVTSVNDLRSSYDYGAGRVDLDLSGLSDVTGPAHTAVRLGSGSVTVTVPDDVPVIVNAQSAVGSVTVDGRRVGGIGAEQARSFGEPSGSADHLTVDIDVAVGSVTVNRVAR